MGLGRALTALRNPNDSEYSNMQPRSLSQDRLQHKHVGVSETGIIGNAPLQTHRKTATWYLQRPVCIVLVLRKYSGSGSAHPPGGRLSITGVYSCTCWLTCSIPFSASCCPNARKISVRVNGAPLHVINPPRASVMSLSFISSGRLISASDAAVYCNERFDGCRNAVRLSKMSNVYPPFPPNSP